MIEDYDEDDIDFDEEAIRISYRNQEAIDVPFDKWRDGVTGRRFVIMRYHGRGDDQTNWDKAEVAYRSAAPGEEDVVCLSSAALQSRDGVARLVEMMRAAWSPEDRRSVGLGSLDLTVDVIHAAHEALHVDCEEYIDLKKKAINEANKLLDSHHERARLLSAKARDTKALTAKATEPSSAVELYGIWYNSGPGTTSGWVQLSNGTDCGSLPFVASELPSWTSVEKRDTTTYEIRRYP